MDYVMALQVNVLKYEVEPQQNGEDEITYKAKLLTAEIVNKKGIRLRVTAKGSASQKQRQYLENLGEDKGIDGQEYYNLMMPKIHHWLPEIIQFIDKRENV
jgi:hypothetical protein